MKRIIAITLAVVLLLAIPVAVLANNAEPITDLWLSTDFSVQWGTGSIDSVQDLDEGVGFAVIGLTAGGTGIGDNWPISGNGPGAPHSVFPVANPSSDFTAFDEYKLEVTNLGVNGVSMLLYMNTGFTGTGNCAGAIPYSPAALACDTYWQGAWTYIAPGDTVTLELEFDDVTAYNIADDPVYTGIANGTSGLTIFRLDEVSHIGFQVADFSGGPISTWLVVRGP